MFKGKVCLVTGGSKGIGKEIAKALFMQGYHVIINYHLDKTAAEKTRDEITRTHSWSLLPQVLIAKADVSNEREVKSMVKAIIGYFGRIDILVNNAGIYTNAMSWKMKKADWERVLAVNLTGPFLCAKHVIPHMRANGWGRIINISSVLGQMGAFGGCNYAASKAGLFGLTKSLARESASFGITVNCVVAGYANTGMSLTLPTKILKWVKDNTLLKRLAKPEEFASVVVFLCENNAGYITGQLIPVNGGLYL